MKQKLPFLMMLGLALLSSCASYQLSTISAQNESQNIDPFTFENDSVKIVYNFKGFNAPLTLSIQNKLNQPIYVDWNKSVLVFDDNSISLSGADIQIRGSLNGSIQNNGSISSSVNQNANLTSSKSLNVDYLIPQATIKRKTIYVANNMIRNLPDKNLGYSYISYVNGSGVTKVPTATFDINDTPLKFKSYITLYTEDKNGKIINTMNYVKNFYVSDIKNINSAPDEFNYYKEAINNVFYTGKITSFGSSMGLNEGSLSRSSGNNSASTGGR